MPAATRKPSGTTKPVLPSPNEVDDKFAVEGETSSAAEVAAPIAATPTAPPANFFDAKTLAGIKAAPAWQPLDGDTLTGELIAVIKRKDKDVGDYPCAIVRPETDDTDKSAKFIAVHAFHDDLPADLKSVGAKRGENVTFVYASKRSAKRLGKDNATYSVVPANGGELDVYEF